MKWVLALPINCRTANADVTAEVETSVNLSGANFRVFEPFKSLGDSVNVDESEKYRATCFLIERFPGGDFEIPKPLYRRIPWLEARVNESKNPKAEAQAALEDIKLILQCLRN